VTHDPSRTSGTGTKRQCDYFGFTEGLPPGVPGGEITGILSPDGGRRLFHLTIDIGGRLDDAARAAQFGTPAAARRRRSRLVWLLCRNGRRPEIGQCRRDKPYPVHGCASMCCLSQANTAMRPMPPFQPRPQRIFRRPPRGARAASPSVIDAPLSDFISSIKSDAVDDP